MKKIEIAKAIGLADENFVAEAAPAATKTKSIFWRKFAIAAACVSIIVTSVCLGLLPNLNEGDFDVADIENLPDELKPYADSEYIDLLYAIYKSGQVKYADTYLDGEYENFAPNSYYDIFYVQADLNSSVADALDGIDGVYKPDSVTDEEFYFAETSTGSYVETTDNQVKDVTEADLFKRTKTHIFYLDQSNNNIYVYSIAGEESKRVSFCIIPNSVRANEMFLSQDGKTLTILCSDGEKKYSSATNSFYYDTYSVLISYDVSDPENIKENSRFAITGAYKTARVVDGKILLFSSSNMNRHSKNDYSEIERIVPSINCGDGFAPIPADDIIFPENPGSSYYTVVTKLNESDLAFEGSIACLSYSSAVYVSTDKIFLTRSYIEYVEREKDGEKHVDRVNMTEIAAISYKGKSFEKLGSVSIEGNVKNQYSLDEYNGVLRVVTTTGGTSYFPDKYLLTDEGFYYGTPGGEKTKFQNIASNAALYCIDLSNFKIVGEVRDFAPDGETVESVRFDGTNAYVCTAVVVTLTDPVYFFDLSDVSNITYTDTGVIEGYSSSLVNFGDGLLLGIGFGESRNILKIEVYAEEGDAVISLASYEVGPVDFATDYKSYFIDRERGLVGLMVNDWRADYDVSRYILLGFDGYQLFEVVDQKFDDTKTPNYARATIADNYFYIMAFGEFKALKLFD